MGIRNGEALSVYGYGLCLAEAVKPAPVVGVGHHLFNGLTRTLYRVELVGCLYLNHGEVDVVHLEDVGPTPGRVGCWVANEVHVRLRGSCTC